MPKGCPKDAPRSLPRVSREVLQSNASVSPGNRRGREEVKAFGRLRLPELPSGLPDGKPAHPALLLLAWLRGHFKYVRARRGLSIGPGRMRGHFKILGWRARFDQFRSRVADGPGLGPQHRLLDAH